MSVLNFYPFHKFENSTEIINNLIKLRLVSSLFKRVRYMRVVPHILSIYFFKLTHLLHTCPGSCFSLAVV